MDIQGLQPIVLVPRTETQPLGLQLNQRIAALVLQVSGDQVLLSLEGVPVVARLTSSEQASNLVEQRVAHFLVKENLGSSIQLQLLPTSVEPTPIPQKTMANLVPNLLNMAGLATDKQNSMIAEALLKAGLPITQDLVNELRTALSQTPNWGATQAQQAATLKSEGLPVTPATISLALAQTNSPPLPDLISNLKGKLEQLATLPLHPKEAEQLQKAINLLEQLQVNWYKSNGELVKELRQALTTLAQPIERELSKLIQNEATPPQAQNLSQLPTLTTPGGQAGFERELVKFMQQVFTLLDTPENQAIFQNDLTKFILGKLQFQDKPENQAAFQADLTKFINDNVKLLNTQEGRAEFERELTRFVLNKIQLPQTGESDKEKWMTLARLPNDLAGKAPESLGKDIDQFLDRVRWMQFRNVETQTPPIKGNWLTLELPVAAIAQGNLQNQPETVQIRIAYQSEGGEKREIDINNTHLVLHFDIDESNCVDVDLAIIAKKIGARVTVSNPQLQPLAEEELTGLEKGLEELGFFMQTVHCETNLPLTKETNNTPTGNSSTTSRLRLDSTGDVDIEA